MTRIEHETVGLYDEESGDIVYAMVRHRVGECPYCDRVRSRRIANEFIRRLDASGLDAGRLHLWSLGSSLKDSAYNRKILTGWWRDFSKGMNKYSSWDPVFRVMESGRRGYLHFHVVIHGFVSHAVVLERWRRITGEKSNVNVSPLTGDGGQLAGYLTKYLTKGSGETRRPGTYRWLGSFYGLKMVSDRPTRALKHMGSTPYHGPTVNAYNPPSRQKKL